MVKETRRRKLWRVKPMAVLEQPDPELKMEITTGTSSPRIQRMLKTLKREEMATMPRRRPSWRKKWSRIPRATHPSRRKLLRVLGFSREESGLRWNDFPGDKDFWTWKRPERKEGNPGKSGSNLDFENSNDWSKEGYYIDEDHYPCGKEVKMLSQRDPQRDLYQNGLQSRKVLPVN